jgi:hypothetical protein
VLTRIVILVSWLRLWLLWPSIIVLSTFAVEVVLLAMMGAVRLQSVLGPLFYAVHLLVFVLGTPALANVLILRRIGKVPTAFVVVPLCTAFALVLVLLQYGVSEALFGIE